ncbi:phenoloxidase-activating factor 3-like isoform X4 [Eriocheir sinensis]|uniref:phenoloxidase-activating factor 3-like isoform X4 n=1 Tax=Eriocheir sinensis TaxID=95602 RepID=UPI0021C64905|nr:phenoloxidase-activating factor 3-like isoform X4 [Eriocheir sinensis]
MSDNVEYWVRLGEYNRNHDRSGELIPVVKGPIPSSVRYADELAADTASLSPLEQNIFVEGIINHPEYDLLLKYYDIALLKLSTKANLTERVLPACLPTDPSQDLVGHELTVIGWGHTQFGHRVLSRILQKVNVPVVDQLECQFKYPDYLGRDTPKGILKDQLCAGKTGRDSCKGDSGGPIIDQKERGGSRCEHTVEGIVSFGRGCGELGVYTRVSSYLDWITGHIAPGDY